MLVKETDMMIADAYLRGYEDGVKRTMKDLEREGAIKILSVDITENADTGEVFTDFKVKPLKPVSSKARDRLVAKKKER
jgi:hypothetical protein